MTSQTINSVELAYDETGQGEPMLLLHAGVADRHMWDDVLPAFAERFRVIRMDLRGYGETPLPDGPFVYAADAAELLRSLDAAPAHVIGVSMGGGVAVDLAVAHPELVRSLVLVAAGIGDWEWSESMNRANAAETEAWESGDLDETAWVNVRTWVDGPSRGPDEVDPELRRRVFEMTRHALDWDNDAAEGGWLVPDRHLRLGEIAVPALVVAGELDQPDFPSIARRLSELIPDARLELLPNVSHLPPMEAPAEFSRLVLEFLER